MKENKLENQHAEGRSFDYASSPFVQYPRGSAPCQQKNTLFAVTTSVQNLIT